MWEILEKAKKNVIWNSNCYYTILNFLHTLTGAYRYVDARKENNIDKRNKSAIFISPILKGGTNIMKFAYSMYGKDMGSLRVSTVNPTTGAETVAFEKSGDQGKGPEWSWFDACISLPTTGSYKVITSSFYFVVILLMLFNIRSFMLHSLKVDYSTVQAEQI